MDSIVKGEHYELTSKTGGCTVCVTGYLPGVGRLLVGLLLLLQLLLVLVLLLEGEEEAGLDWLDPNKINLVAEVSTKVRLSPL